MSHVPTCSCSYVGHSIPQTLALHTCYVFVLDVFQDSSEEDNVESTAFKSTTTPDVNFKRLHDEIDETLSVSLLPSPKRSPGKYSPNSNVFHVSEVEKFCICRHKTSDWLKKEGRKLNLVITASSRNPLLREDRIGFGLPRKIRQALPFKTPTTLFHFGIQKDGLYIHGKKNQSNLTIYRQVVSHLGNEDSTGDSKNLRRGTRVRVRLCIS